MFWLAECEAIAAMLGGLIKRKKQKIRNTEYGIRNTEYGIRNTEFRNQNSLIRLFSSRTAAFRFFSSEGFRHQKSVAAKRRSVFLNE